MAQRRILQPTKDFFFNGEAVVVYHVPDAHTDGDSLVFFRRSDVLSTGDVFTPGTYPIIDLERGGSVQGEIDALNKIIEITVPAKYQEGGTQVIPGHGRLCDEADVVEYRNMLTIIRDRFRGHDQARHNAGAGESRANSPWTTIRNTDPRPDSGPRKIHRRRVQKPEQKNAGGKIR